MSSLRCCASSVCLILEGVVLDCVSSSAVLCIWLSLSVLFYLSHRGNGKVIIEDSCISNGKRHALSHRLICFVASALLSSGVGSEKRRGGEMQRIMNKRRNPVTPTEAASNANAGERG